TIQFSIPEQSFVTLEIFNALGEKITTLVSKELNAGNNESYWVVYNMPSGIYFYELQSGSFIETKKMLMIK
ncbi:MAG: T9SS type A sorting domain-containing protein, partial [Ignavibacteriaceae bacterium]